MERDAGDGRAVKRGELAGMKGCGAERMGTKRPEGIK
jgi:hypothetical protein